MKPTQTDIARHRAEAGTVSAHLAPNMPDAVVSHWETAYRAYSAADDDSAESARLSAEVAATWRQMAAVPGLTWWLVAALSTAAEAFESQAQAWSADVPRDRSGQLFEWRTGSHPQVGSSGDRFPPSVSGSVK